MMGWGVDFGPPKAIGFDPPGDWCGERKLNADELAELVTHDDGLVADTLARLEKLEPAPQKTDLRQARLRRVAILAGDPEIAYRAQQLSERLV